MRAAAWLLLVVTVLVVAAEASSSSAADRRKTTEFGQCDAATTASRRPVTSHRLEGRALPCASRRSILSVQLGDAAAPRCVITCVRVVDDLVGGASSAVTVGGGVVDARCAVVDVSAPERRGFCFRVEVYSNCSNVARFVRYQQTLTSSCCCHQDTPTLPLHPPSRLGRQNPSSW